MKLLSSLRKKTAAPEPRKLVKTALLIGDYADWNDLRVNRPGGPTRDQTLIGYLGEHGFRVHALRALAAMPGLTPPEQKKTEPEESNIFDLLKCPPTTFDLIVLDVHDRYAKHLATTDRASSRTSLSEDFDDQHLKNQLHNLETALAYKREHPETRLIVHIRGGDKAMDRMLSKASDSERTRLRKELSLNEKKKIYRVQATFPNHLFADLLDATLPKIKGHAASDDELAAQQEFPIVIPPLRIQTTQPGDTRALRTSAWQRLLEKGPVQPETAKASLR